MKTLKICLVVVGMGTLAGCSNEGLVKENGRLKRERTEKNAEIAQLKESHAFLDEKNRSLRNINGHLAGEIAQLKDDIERLEERGFREFLLAEVPHILELQARLKNLDEAINKIADKGRDAYTLRSTESTLLAMDIHDLMDGARKAFDKRESRHISDSTAQEEMAQLVRDAHDAVNDAKKREENILKRLRNEL